PGNPDLDLRVQRDLVDRRQSAPAKIPIGASAHPVHAGAGWRESLSPGWTVAANGMGPVHAEGRSGCSAHLAHARAAHPCHYSVGSDTNHCCARNRKIDWSAKRTTHLAYSVAK